MSQRRLKLEIENFGPIASGSFELYPLTLFIGPNNSGKSYAATLTYSIVRALQSVWEDMIHRLHSAYLAELAESKEEESNELVTRIFIFLSLERLKREHPDRIISMLQKVIQEALSDEEFGSRMRILIQNNFSCQKIEDLISNFSEEGISNIQIGITNFQDELIKIQLSKNKSYQFSGAKDFRLPVQDINIGDLVSFEKVIGIPANVHYLPAARSGIVQGWRALASQAIRRVSLWAGIEPIEVPRLPGLIGQFLSELILATDRTRSRRSVQEFHSVIEVLEESVLRGQVHFERMGEEHIPELIYQPKGFMIPVWRSSSAVGELAPLILWIRYVLRPGDLLIIEEPEAHLHPENQRQVARALVRLVRAGVKVICTTHSSLILHQISNHLLATQAEPERRRKLGFTESDLLGEDEVGVYLFKMREDGNGSEIHHIPLEPGFGIPEDEFLRVYEAIGEETYHLTGPLNVEIGKE